MEEQNRNHFNRQHDSIANPHAAWQRSERIIHQHQIRHTTSRRRRVEHRNPQIGFFDRQRIIHAVADHSRVETIFLECCDDFFFLIRKNARKNRIFANRQIKIFIRKLGEFSASDEFFGIFHASFTSDETYSFRIIARNHAQRNATILEKINSFADIFAQRIFECHDRDWVQFFAFKQRFDFARFAKFGKQKHAQTFASQLVNLFRNLFGEFSIFEILQDKFWRAKHNRARGVFGFKSQPA